MRETHQNPVDRSVSQRPTISSNSINSKDRARTLQRRRPDPFHSKFTDTGRQCPASQSPLQQEPAVLVSQEAVTRLVEA